MRRSAVVAWFALASMACGNSEHAPPPSGGFEIDAGEDGFVLPPDDAAINCSAGPEAGVCACKEIGQKPTPVYLVLDHSGSMAEASEGKSTKWQTVLAALFDAKTGVVRSLGARISLGIAIFPSNLAGADACTSGRQVVAPSVLDSKTYDSVYSGLASQTPRGGTPTAATLRALAPVLKALPQPAYVLLATDGAPNCGSTPCTADRCTFNIDKSPKCDPATNCCDPKNPDFGITGCIDSDATKAAVADLAAAGLKVFVFGIPGVGPYGADLDELAKAGGTAREDAMPGEPLYYAATASTQTAFAEALQAVAAKLVDSCVITLESKPEDPGVTNVVVDGKLVPQDPVDGWTWGPDGSTVELRGATCDRVKKGLVSTVQVAVGCRTITR